MSITTSSVFNAVIVTLRQDERVNSVFARTEEETRQSTTIYFTDHYPESGTSERTDLDTLIEIYNTHGGFPDEDGNVMDARVRGEYDDKIDFDQLETLGYFNPFAGEDAYNQWVEGRKAVHALVLTGSVDEDDDTGRRTIKVASDLGTRNRTPEGSTYDAALDAWQVRAVDANDFELVHAIDPDLQYTTGNIGDAENSEAIRDLPGFRAMSALFDSLTTTDLSADLISHIVPASYAGIDFTWEQSSGQNITVRITNASRLLYRDLNHQTYVIALRIHCTVQSGSANEYDEDALQNYLDAETVATPIDGQAIEASEMGTVESRGRFDRIYLGSGASFLTRKPDGSILDTHVDPATGHVHETPISGKYGETIAFADLSVATGDTYRRWPTRPYVDGVYFTGADGTDRDLQTPLPVDFVNAKDRDRPFFVHNEADGSDGDDDVLRLRDWNGDVFFNVLPNERIALLMRQKKHGRGEVISVGELPDRKLIYTLTYNNGLEDLGDWARLDANDPESGDFFVMPYPTGDYDFQIEHDDYFETKSEAFANDTDVWQISNESDFWKSGAWKIKGGTAGLLRIEAYILLRKKSDADGSITNPRIQVYRFDGSDVDQMIDQVVQNVWVAGERVALTMTAEALIEQNDIVLPGLFRRGPSSLSADDVEARQATIDVTVKPRITLEHTP